MSGLSLSGHTWATAQIRKHGRDRYPTIGAQYRKVLGELGELGEELISACAQPPSHEHAARVRREYADTGLALFELGNKMGLDLLECMAEVVENDERDFT